MSKKVEPTENSSSGSAEGKNVTRIIHDSINNEPKKVVVSDPTSGNQHKNKSNPSNNVQVRFFSLSKYGVVHTTIQQVQKNGLLARKSPQKYMFSIIVTVSPP